MKEIRETSLSSAKDKGKQIDFTRMQAEKSEMRRSSERIELASVSTRENPRLLGGTPDDARKYLNGLSDEDRQKYRDFEYARKLRGTEIAKRDFKEGHQLYLEYNRQYHKKPPKEEGSSSRSKQEDTSQSKSYSEQYKDSWGSPELEEAAKRRWWE